MSIFKFEDCDKKLKRRIAEADAEEAAQRERNRANRAIAGAEVSKGDVGDKGPGESAVVQERKAGICMDGQGDGKDNGATDHPARAQNLDAKSRGKYRLTITLRFSNKRPCDADGCVSTLLDCLVTARRLLDGDPRAIRKMRANNKPWKRRGDDRDRETPVKEEDVPF